MKKDLFPILLLILSCGCSAHKTGKIPPAITKLKNLTVYNPNTQPADTVELIKKTVFQSTKNVYFAGYIGELAIDDSDRVYLGAGSPGKWGIYVFKPNGKYIATVGRSGRGPGEFESIGSLSIAGGKLYVFDPRLKRVSIFSLNDFSHLDDELISKNKLTKSDRLAKRLNGSRLFVTSDGTQLLKLSILTPHRKDDVPKILIYRLSGNGALIPGYILKLERYHLYFPKSGGGMRMPFPMPFTRESLIAITNAGSFYTAWTEKFLIKEYGRNGKYLRAFYYPINKIPLSLNTLHVDHARQTVLNNYSLPKTWPALRDMEADNLGRLWVETTTASTDSFKWWVLNPNGKLIARFNWPGDRSREAVMVKPLIKIRHGYFYAPEFDSYGGIIRIVKYKVEFRHR